jgi:hypothetical protein
MTIDAAYELHTNHNGGTTMMNTQTHAASETPVINFAAGAARRSSRAHTPSIVERACAKFEAALAEFKSAHEKFACAEDDSYGSMPRADSRILSTKRNLADVTCFPAGRSSRIAINSNEIRREITSLRSNNVKAEKVDGKRHIEFSDDGFPLTPKQRARLKRLEAKLSLALAHERKCDAVAKRFKLRELDAAAQVHSSKLNKLAAQLTDLPSRNRQDLLAKVRIYELDPDLLDGDGLGRSIAKDVARLAASAAI